jgi:electron transfer flavoprotein alpha subunit
MFLEWTIIKQRSMLAESYWTRNIRRLLISGTLRGRELAPYVANVLGTGITADYTGFDVDEATRDVLQIRPLSALSSLAFSVQILWDD